MTKPPSEEVAKIIKKIKFNNNLEIQACLDLRNIENKLKALESSIREKDEMIEAMKNCSNCIHYTSPLCIDCSRNELAQVGYDNWQMKTKG